MGPKTANFKLPPEVVTLHDVTKLIVEIEKLEVFMTQMRLGKLARTAKPPTVSNALESTLRTNGVNLIKEDERTAFKLHLQSLRTQAPTVHISFSGDPSTDFMETLITWMRANLNPLLILQIGLQPNIGAGFTLRTKNKFFDFSLRQNLEAHSADLLKELSKGAA